MGISGLWSRGRRDVGMATFAIYSNYCGLGSVGCAKFVSVEDH